MVQAPVRLSVVLLILVALALCMRCSSDAWQSRLACMSTGLDTCGLAQGHHSEALEQLDQAVQLAPEEPLPRLLLGIAHLAAAMSRKIPDRDRAVLLAFTYLQVWTDKALVLHTKAKLWCATWTLR